MTLYEKSLRTLELPAVLERLAAEAVSAAGKENALALQPVTDFHEARYRLEETSAARIMISIKGTPAFFSIKDIRSSVRRADIGGMLNTIELLDIAALLRSAAAASAYASGNTSEKSVIDHLFFGLRSNKYLENKISGCITGPDEIADSASTVLAGIRRSIRIAGDRVRTSLNKIITSPTYQKALQEAIITVKNDRFVVPVRADHKSSVPGLVHDVSSSGATLFIEPMGVVELNNELRQLAAKEKQEIERILMELSVEVAEFGDDIISDFQTLTELDLIFAKAKLGMRQNAHEPELTEARELVLRRCRHPLLDPSTAVATDIRLGGEFNTLVITGPNTGGKTVALKTLGLFCAMAQCGLHIPAESGSRMPVFEKILADIGDEQSIEQSLSTFSSHMTNIVGILAECEGDSLLLFDELGAGTDPVEGAALAISIIEYARSAGALVAATTHYSELKIYALATAGVENASCEFDVETLRPTYRLLIGVPGRSNAFAISQRLGLPEVIIEASKNRLSGEDESFEEAVGKLETARRAAENDRDDAYKFRADAERDARLAEKYRAELERDREKLKIEARQDAKKLIDETRAHADAIIEELREIRRAAREDGEMRAVNEAVPDILRELNEMESQSLTSLPKREDEPEENLGEIVAGDRVRILKYDTDADVISVNGNTLELQAGVMKISAKKKEVRKIAKPEPKQTYSGGSKTAANGPRAAVSPELDLRGMMVDEAIPVMERYLDSARLAHLENVTIIHGKGTGALRAAVHQTLKGESFIKAFRLGRFGEGEMGVTIVTFK